MEELIGIENLKKLIKFSCDFSKQIAEATKDGFQWTDAFGFIDEAAQIPGVAKSFPEIKKELADLSAEETNELALYLKEQFDIPNDKLEAAIENSLMQAISFIALYEMWRDLKA